MWRLLVVAILSLILPGLAQIYHGQRIKGIIFYLINIAVVVLQGYVTSISFWVLYVVVLIDGIVFILKQQQLGKRKRSEKRAIVETAIATVAGKTILLTVNLLLYLGAHYIPLYIEQQRGESNMEQIEEEVLIYLKEKYQDEFSIIDTDYIPKTGWYTLRVKSKKRPDIDFLITKDADGEIVDTYTALIWGEQGEADIKSLLQSIYPERMYYSSTVWISEDTEEKLITDGEIPTLKQILALGYSYDLDLNIKLIKTITKHNIKTENENIKKIISYFKENNITGSLQIEYYSETVLTDNIDTVSLANQYQYTDELEYMFGPEEVEKILDEDDFIKMIMRLD